MKPYLPQNAYDLVKERDEMRSFLEKLENITPDENGTIRWDSYTTKVIGDNIRNGIRFAECLLYFMNFIYKEE